MMRIDVPPNAWMSELLVNVNRIDGTTAMMAKNSEPGSVMWLSTFLM